MAESSSVWGMTGLTRRAGGRVGSGESSSSLNENDHSDFADSACRLGFFGAIVIVGEREFLVRR